MTESWNAPGGGRWEQDAEHVPEPITRYLFATAQSLFGGMAESMRRYGIPLEGFDTRLVAGRLYGRARPVGAPDPDRFGGGPRGGPPKPLMWLLFRLHPELRRRARTAAETLRTRRWREDAARWRGELEPALRARNLELGRVDLAALDDAALAAHIDKLDAAFSEGFRQHGRQFGATALPLGLWLRRTLDWTGAAPERVLEVLRGTSPASAAAVASVDRIAEAVRATDGATAILNGQQDPGTRLSGLAAASPWLATAIEAWLTEDGYRPVTGVDLIDQTAREMPGLLLDSVDVRAGQGPDRPAEGDTASAAQRLRELVPPEHRAEYDDLFADARALFGIRDDDVWVTTQWPAGMLRHALLEAARRLLERGAIQEIENVFDTLPGEVAGLMRGAAEPGAQELANRTAERRAYADQTPPLTFGDDPGPLEIGLLPRALGEVTAAMMITREIDRLAASGRPAQAAAPSASDTVAPVAAQDGSIRGLGVSAGRYSGRARVVLGPADFGRIEVGDVLVARTTSPAYNVLLPLIGAVVTDRGGLLSHAALVAREFGIPAVVGTSDATARIADGATITVDAEQGLVLLT